MTDTELLKKVKSALGITGDYQNETIKTYIDEVKLYLDCCGVSKDILESNVSVGVISRGVADLWNYGSGNAHLSEYFMQRAAQLAYASLGSGDGGVNNG